MSELCMSKKGKTYNGVKKIFCCIIGVTFIAVFNSAPSGLAEERSVRVKEYTAKTTDGWRLSITRFTFTADDGHIPKKASVILCHGFNLNAKFWDLDRRSSLARFLAKNDYDVWVPSLRGAGRSSRPLLSNIRNLLKLELENMPHLFIKAPFDAAKFDWSIDDHIHKDVPAIINFVKEKSGFDKLYWIGHSMGGIVMFGYLETEGQADIAGFVVLSSMIVIPEPLNPHLEAIANQRPLTRASLIINTAAAGQLRNLTLGTVKHPIEDLLINRENMYEDVVFRFFRIAIDDTSAGVVTQFSKSIRAGEILSKDGRYSYTAHLGRITVPILLAIGGAADGFLSEESFRRVYAAVSSSDKDIVVFSKANGYSADYGHCDLVVGKNSEKEVYPVILKWLDSRNAN